MLLTVLFFASAQDAANGLASLSHPIPHPATLASLALALGTQYPALVEVLRTSSWAVNEEMVPDEEVATWSLKEGDVVAVLPPVSGG